MFVCFWTQGREKFTSCVQHEDRARSVKLILRIKIHWFLQMCADTGWGAGKGVKCQRSWRSLSLSLPVRWSMWTTMETNWAREWWSWPTPSSSSIPIAAMTSGGLICACAAMATTLTCSRSRAAAAARRAKVRIRVCQQEMRSPQDRVCVCWLKVFLVSGLCLAMIRCQEGGVGGAVRSGGLVSLSRMSFVLPRPRSVLISCRWKSVWVKTCLQCVWCVIHLALVPVRSQQNHQNDPDQ